VSVPSLAVAKVLPSGLRFVKVKGLGLQMAMVWQMAMVGVSRSV
jgi:hypothetical protein